MLQSCFVLHEVPEKQLTVARNGTYAPAGSRSHFLELMFCVN